MPKPYLWKNSSGTIQALVEGDKGVHIFPQDINPKGNVIVQLEFELTYNNVAAQYVCRYASLALLGRDMLLVGPSEANFPLVSAINS